MKEIPLSQGKIALVDDEDYVWLNQWKWYAVKDYNTYYAIRHDEHIHSKFIRMHRLILNVKETIKIDHQDRNGLNNQRSNLRKATTSQNGINKITSPNMTGYRGVTFVKSTNKFAARIKVMGVNIFLGSSRNKEVAAKKYDIAALKYFGEFAILNFKI